MVGNGGCFCRKICYNSVILFEGEPDLKLSRLVFPPDGASRGTLRAHRAYLAVLLTLLHLGVRNIRLGPDLPAFVSPGVLGILVERFGLQGITTAEADLQACLAK